MRRLFFCLMLTVVLLTSSGCCKMRNCEPPNVRDAGQSNWYNPYERPFKTHTGELLKDSIKKRLMKADGKPQNILILSGGGQNGAYGAGFVNGLADRSDPFNLKFDFVTGISTGALQATFIFVGGKTELEILKSAYTNITREQIYRTRSPFEMLYSSSLKDTAPLRLMIKKKITDGLIDKVAIEYEKTGRNIYIGTVNLDNGMFLPWNMGEIAKEAYHGNVEAYQLYRDVILASTAVPVVFPPVLLKEKSITANIYEGLHVDGGVRKNVFCKKIVEAFLAAVRDARSESGSVEKIPKVNEATLSVIVNGKIGRGYKCVPDCLIDIGTRSLSVLMDELNVSAILRVYALACANKMSFRMTSIPDNVEIDDDSLTFDPETMGSLYNAGYAEATEPQIPWKTMPPYAEDIAELCKCVQKQQ